MCSTGSLRQARWVVMAALMLGLPTSDGHAQDVARIRRHIAELEQRKVELIAATDSLMALERARRLQSLDSLQVGSGNQRPHICLCLARITKHNLTCSCYHPFDKLIGYRTLYQETGSGQADLSCIVILTQRR